MRHGGGFKTINSSKTATAIGTEEQSDMRRIPSDELPLHDIQNTGIEYGLLMIQTT